ncbi:MAG: hypothetical protein RL562_667 [Planctomycetota bacterium]
MPSCASRRRGTAKVLPNCGRLCAVAGVLWLVGCSVGGSHPPGRDRDSELIAAIDPELNFEVPLHAGSEAALSSGSDTSDSSVIGVSSGAQQAREPGQHDAEDVAPLHEAAALVSGCVRVAEARGVQVLTFDRGRSHGITLDDVVLVWIRGEKGMLGLAYCRCWPGDQVTTLRPIVLREKHDDGLGRSRDAQQVLDLLADIGERESVARQRAAAQSFSDASMAAGAALLMQASQAKSASDEERSNAAALGTLAAIVGLLARPSDDEVADGRSAAVPETEMFGTVVRRGRGEPAPPQ